ncbi:MAG: hypothetical protein ACI4D3_03760 [Lachnospiraceae bacterium]
MRQPVEKTTAAFGKDFPKGESTVCEKNEKKNEFIAWNVSFFAEFILSQKSDVKNTQK